MALKFKHKIKVGLKTRGSEKERKVYIQENREIRTESDARRKTGLKEERSGVRSVTQK
jgi:hypothetical protein